MDTKEGFTLRQGMQSGLTTLKHKAGESKARHDSANREAIDRIEQIEWKEYITLIWHVECYGKFTHKSEIKQLNARLPRGRPKASSSKSDPVATPVQSSRMKRTKTN